MVDTLSQDAVKLTGDGRVFLYRFDLHLGGIMLFTPNQQVTWQGDTYESHGITFSGYKRTSDEQLSRPSLTLFNPEGQFSAQVLNAKLEFSVVTRFEVLRNHLLADLNIFRKTTWYVNAVVNLTPAVLSLELRNILDGPNFTLPPRKYVAPDYPTVSQLG
jgi:phage-related protein